MSPVGGIGETIPAVLQLQKWNHWPFPVELSEISRASISPTRRLLLLLSHQSEALILPLSFDRDYSEGNRGSDNSPSCASTSVSAISDVKSFAWGHFGDGYRQFQDSGFRELLFVAGGNQIIVHAFRDPDRNEVFTGSENGGAKWVEWGPAHSKNADGGSPSLQKHWLRSYRTELDTFVSTGKYSAKFPARSSSSHSADVVSFDIFDCTMRFLEFLSSTGPPTDDAENQNNNCCAGATFTCWRVFTSSSNSLVGLVLTSSKESLVEKSEDHIGYAGKVLVVVLMIYQWGIQWVCSVDLQDQCLGPGPSPEWADFQFLEDFLVCLTTSGMICMWGVKSGSFLASFDVMTSLGLEPKVSFGLNQPKLSVDRESASPAIGLDGEVNLESEAHGSEKGVRGRVHSRIFRRLMVVSHSLLLAVLDEHGVVYVIWAADYISEKLKTFKRFIQLSQLSRWKAAGCEIGGEKQLSDFCQGQCLYVPDMIKGLSNKYYTRAVQLTACRLNNYSSGLSPAARINDWEISHAKASISSAPLRRIFLPLKRFNKEDYICFSPFGITRLVRSSSIEEQRACKIVHSTLHVISSVPHDGDLDLCCLSKRFSSFTQDGTSVGESIGCSFQGFLYLVSRNGLSVILPSVSISSGNISVESIGHCQPSTFAGGRSQYMNVFLVDEAKELGRPWEIEVLDRTLLYEGPEEAEHICLENGWDVKIARLRRMQLALHFLKADEIERSLDKLVDVNLAEEGILRLLFTSVYRIFCKVGSDSEVALARRLLVLAARYATKMVRSYGLLEQKKDAFPYNVKKDVVTRYLQPLWQRHNLDELGNPRRLHEMSHLLEVIRNLQSRLTSKNKKLTESMDVTRTVDMNVNDSSLPIVTMDSASPGLSNVLGAQFAGQLSFTTNELAIDSPPDLALSHTKSSISSLHSHDLNVQEEDNTQRRKLIPLEDHKKMIERWEMDHIDLKAIVKDALYSGRLPLAVLQLHLHRQKELVPEKESHDSFNEVREIGRAIAYDLFLKGESGLAVETLLKLGEDLEIVLRDLLFGTVKRSFRLQIAAEMKNYGYLKSSEWRTLERISLIERLYPSCSFWGTYLGKQKNISEAAPSFTLPETNTPKLKFLVCDNLTIESGDIDGVVTGSWSNIDNDSAEVHENTAFPGYWVSAAIWSDAWDQRTVDRIVLDQPFQMGVHIAWESYFEYHLSHIDLEEIHKLLDVIPASLLSERTLEINLSGWHDAGNIGTDVKFSDHTMYICAAEELEPVFMHIPDVKIFRFSAMNTCSSWLKMLVEQELAKRLIFLKEYWGSTAEIMPLLARARLITDTSKVLIKDKLSKSSLDLEVLKTGEDFQRDSRVALHKLVVHFCTQYSLPNLLDLYLDHQNVVLDDDSLCPLLEAAGDSQWTKWLLFSRIKGHVYEASLSNARSNMSRQMIHGSNLSVLEIDEIIPTVDDMAEGGGEMAALATLMYATLPMQKCLCTGSVNRHASVSSQCTLENLRPALQKFPMLWRALITGCIGLEDNGLCFKSNTTNMFGKSAFSDYLNWRDTIFFSTAGDTSLVQMLPCWFPKSVRRLVKHFVQGPMGWQPLAGAVPVGESSLYRGHSFVVNSNGSAAVSPINWEAAIQRSIEEELYSSLEEKGFGVEHHLHRGRALAAFKHILGLRALKLKSTSAHQERSGQTKIQSDVQAILAPLNQSEGSLLSSVVPLAITHFEDSVLFASCTFLLELCGLSASVLRVDVAAMQRISSYYNSIRQNFHYEHVSPKGSAFHVVSREGDFIASLVQALADDYIHHDHLHILEQSPASSKVAKEKQSSRSLMTVLQHLERASLPLMEEGKTCGYWLTNGNGDGSEFRSQQKDASLHWNLVTTFCQMHHLPPSTKYLALLANDNDWVGFLTEAQMGGFPIDVIIEVATRGFRDPRLKTHILTVLRSMYSMKKKTSSLTVTAASKCTEMFLVPENNTMVPMELFGVLADCERQKNPGEALLIKAKNLRWSLLAMIASCFPDVSPLSCLTVWLQITAARETSSIKVNDISSKIANRVGAAVEATNALPTGGRTLTFHYNRRNPKRRCLMEPASGMSKVDASIDVPNMSYSTVADISQELTSEDDKNNMLNEKSKVTNDDEEGLASLSNMVAVLCEQHLFLPLLRAFEMFMPSCSLLPFIRSLQAFSQMRLSEASAHLTSFSARIKEEQFLVHINVARGGLVKTAWISSTAVKAADAMLLTCPSAYEKRCLLQLLAAAEFGDGGSASAYFRRLYWKINLAEPSLRKDEDAYLGNETLDDYSLLTALERNGRWEQARNWARQLESSGASSKGTVHHVTEAQAEAMVVEWKEYLWDVAEERAALWNHCQTLFLRYSFPALQAGLFFLKHAEAVEKDIPASELHEMLLLSLQWLSGTMTQSPPVYPLHLLQEIETRVWLLAVESEAQSKADGEFTSANSTPNLAAGNSVSIIEQTANIVTKMDTHINAVRMRVSEKTSIREANIPPNRHLQVVDFNSSQTAGSSTRTKRRSKTYLQLRRPTDTADTNSEYEDNPSSPHIVRNCGELSRNLRMPEENIKMEASVSGWEEKVRPAEMERAVLSLLEFGQLTAAKQLQHKLSPENVLQELVLIDAALKVAGITSCTDGVITESLLDPDCLTVLQSLPTFSSNHMDPIQTLESLALMCREGSGRGLCWRIISVVKAAKVLGLTFSEAFEKRPVELLQLLSLKAQDSLEEAKLLVETHDMPPASIARILAESFLKGLLAAHRGGYMDSQREEGPAPLLWRFSDFLKWAELCPSEQEIGHALMRLVMTGQDIPHACEVELLILSHHFYKSSSCLDGVDVLVTLAANRVESYVSEGDFSCLARLITGVSNFHALNFILNILIENGQLDLLVQKFSAADTSTGSSETITGFRMAILTSLKLFNPHDLDAFALVYHHFGMKHENAALLESRSMQHIHQWFSRRDKERHTEDLLEAMHYVIEAAEVHSSIDAGQKTYRSCARASLLSLQIRIPDLNWLELSETNARRTLVEQSRFQEALVVAEAYNLNQPSEWAPVLWNQMLKPDLIEEFVAEFVVVLPLQPSMLLELARFYRAEVAARGDQSHFSVWLSPGGLPAEWVKHLGRSFRSLLKRTRDLRLRLQLATIATGFADVVDLCMKVLDKVPENAGPLILRRGHGGTYLPLM